MRKNETLLHPQIANKMKRQNIILLAAVFFAALLLDSCKVGPDFSKPDLPAPATFRYSDMAADSVINLRWWELFNNPELDSLIAIGLRENKDVLKAASRVEQAMITIGFTKADQFPAIGVAGTATAGNVIANQPLSADAGIYLGVLTLNWEIDFWGKFRRATEAARANFVASQYAQRTIQIGLISAITQTYFLLLDYRWRLDVARKTYESRKAALEIIKARFEKGIVPEIDLNQAQIQLSIAQANVPFYERQVATTETALAVLLGRNPYEINTEVTLLKQDFPEEIPPGIPSKLLERRPDVMAAQNRYHAEVANIGVAVAQRFPSISLTGLVGGVASHELSQAVTGGLAWSAGAGLVSPLINWGKNKKRVEIQRQIAQQAAYDYENTVIQAFKEVEDALITVRTKKAELQAREQQMRAALNTRRLSQKRYDGGVTSYLEVLESDRSAFEAELVYAQARQELLSSYILLYKALGGGWITPAEEEAAQQAAAEEQQK